jgi:hypothetical protein
MFGAEYKLVANATVLTADDVLEREIRSRESNSDDVLFLLRRLDEARAKDGAAETV